MARDFISEILQRESRLYPGSTRWEQVSQRLISINETYRLLDVMSDIGSYVFNDSEIDYSNEDVRELADQIRNLGNSTYAEILRYLPIALVACMEGYFRLVYADLIDFSLENPGKPYYQNVSNLEVKFDIKMALKLHEHSVSLGKYVAHQLRVNRFDDICKTMKTLIGVDFKDLLKVKRRELSDGQLVLFEAFAPQFEKEFFAGLDKTFYLRHIYSHELAPVITEEQRVEIVRAFSNSLDFLRIAEAVVQDLLQPSNGS